VLTSSQYTYI